MVKRIEVDKEVEDHPNWCNKECKTFLPEAYREARKRYSAKKVQSDHDLCHIWR